MGLALPQSLMMFCHFFIGLTDVWVAGRLGADIQAILGIITQINILFLTLAMATSSGIVAAITQSLGAGRFRRVQRYVTLTMGGTFFLALGMTLFGSLFQDSLLRFAETPEGIMPVAKQFLQVSLLTLPAHYLVIMSTAVFRATQSLKVAFIITICVLILNVVGDLGFGLGYFGMPKFGAQGIAWATFISVSFGALCLLGTLFYRRLLSWRELPPWRWARVGMPYVLKVALPAFGTTLLWHSGYFVLFVITASLPFQSLQALAGLTIGVRLETFLMVPALACNMSAAVLVGHSLGAGRETEARMMARNIWLICTAFMTVSALFLWPFREALAVFMTPDTAVQAQTVSYLSYNLLSVPFSVTSIVLAGVFNGAGATIFPLVTFSFAVWFVRLPLAYVLGHIVWLDASGVYFSMLVSQMIQSVIIVFVLYKLPWTKYTLRSHSVTVKKL